MYQHSVGKWNTQRANCLFSVGCGTSDSARKDALFIDTSGNVDISGNLKIGSTTLTEAQLINLLKLLS